MSKVALITTSQVATKFRVDASTVRKWVAAGKLRAAARTPGGNYRFDPADLDEYIADRSDANA